MATILEQLRGMTTVVSDTGDINAIKQYKPTDSTTNPSLIQAAAGMPEYQPIVDGVLQQARKDAGANATDEQVAAQAFKTLAVAFGKKILEIIPGRVSTEVDARISYDTEKSIETARDIIKQYESAGISRERVLIKLASHLGGHPGRRAAREGRHPLQHDPSLRPPSGDCLRRGQGDPHLAIRRPHSRLVQEGHR